MTLALGLTYGVFATEKKLNAYYRQLLKIRDMAHEQATKDIISNFDKEINFWKRTVKSTMENSYKVGFEDGQLR